jgi:hypothetical protein
MNALTLVKLTPSPIATPAAAMTKRAAKPVDLLALEAQAQKVRSAHLEKLILQIESAIASADILCRSLDPITRNKGARVSQGLNVIRNEIKR